MPLRHLTAQLIMALGAVVMLRMPMRTSALPGYASAVGYVLFAAVLVFTVLQFKLLAHKR